MCAWRCVKQAKIRWFLFGVGYCNMYECQEHVKNQGNVRKFLHIAWKVVTLLVVQPAVCTPCWCWYVKSVTNIWNLTRSTYMTVIDQKKILFMKKIQTCDNSVVWADSTWNQVRWRYLSCAVSQSLWCSTSKIKEQIWRHFVDSAISNGKVCSV